VTFVISHKCIGTVDVSCIEVCPVDCIYAVGQDPERPDEPLMMVIDPLECIDCAACVIECPVEAITKDDRVPEYATDFLGINAMHAGRGGENGPAFEDAVSKADIADAALAAYKKIEDDD
jgi:NAD-dependent dihydropyrimidine dehydrogenase PreA subunit